MRSQMPPPSQAFPQQMPVSPPPQQHMPQHQGPVAPPPMRAAPEGVPTPLPPRMVPPTSGGGAVGYPIHPAPAPKRRRGLLVSLAAVLLLVAGAGAAVYFVLDRDNRGPGTDTKAATNVGIDVRDDRVTITWSDPSNGVAQPIIIGFRESEGWRRFAVPPKGANSAVLPGLNKNFEYCFAVVLAYSEEDLKESDQVCTNRKNTAPSPSR